MKFLGINSLVHILFDKKSYKCLVLFDYFHSKKVPVSQLASSGTIQA